MIQNFKAFLIDEKKNVYSADPFISGDGRQIMEHSHIGNDFMSIVLTAIKNQPMTVAWLGDKAQIDDRGYEAAMAKIKGRKAENIGKIVSKAEEFDYIGGDKHESKYLINHDKKEYLDMESYSVRSCYRIPDKSPESEFVSCVVCINPLSLLTAIGNGRGETDYAGHNDEYVGYWAGDRLSVAEQCPVGFKEISPCFIENSAYKALKNHPGWQPSALQRG